MGALGAAGGVGALGVDGVPGAAGAAAGAFGAAGAAAGGVGASSLSTAVEPVVGLRFGVIVRVAREGLTKDFSAGAGSSPLTRMESRSRVDTSRGLAAAPRAFTPPANMLLQNGQPVAMSVAPVARACSVRNSFMRCPIFSSMNMRAPPAPQQNASSRFLSISATCIPVDSSSSRGGSNTLLWRPKKHGSW